MKLLESDEPQLGSAVTAALATLAENPTCQAMIAAEGAIEPLVSMAQFGADMQKLSAMSALDVLSVNNAGARTQMQQHGAAQVLSGIASMGSGLLRDEARAFGERLAQEAPTGAKMSADEHMKAARHTRTRYDGVRQRAFQRMSGWESREQ